MEAGSIMDDWKSKVVYDNAPASNDWKSKVVYDDQPTSIKKSGTIKTSEGLLTYPITKSIGLLAQGYNQFIDPISGAPVRSAIGALEEGKGLKGAITSYGNQFGSSEGAPTPQQLGEKTGIKNPYLQKVSGNLISTLTDPATYAFLGENKIAQGREGLASGIKDATVRGGEALTGVPKKASEIYLQRSKEVNALGKATGGNVAEGADLIRKQFETSLQNKRTQLNQQIENSLNLSSSKKIIDESPIINQLEEKKSRINKKLNPEEISEINSIEKRIKSISKIDKPKDSNAFGYPEEPSFDKNEINVKDLYDIKNYLQDKGSPSYLQSGQIYVPGKQSQQAAKSAAAVSRKLLNKEVPEIASANNQHSMLHNIEDTLPKGLLVPGTNENPLIRAGMQEGRESKLLGLLDKQGIDATRKAEDLAAMKHLYDPKLINPTASRSAVSSVAGGLLGGAIGHGNPITTALGLAAGYILTSPKALKIALDAGIISRPALESATGLNLSSMNGISKAHEILKKNQNETHSQ